MTPRLLDLFKADMAALVGTNDRSTARLYWTRAVLEETNGRQLSAEVIPTQRSKTNRVERFKPYWARVADDELEEVLLYLLPYFRRPENRSTPL